ncbi:MAG TPA: hypothetical protein VFW71_14240 [Actinomycetota bacterium]|nr:hypothetical protein [Actinomycetota bacterium]
MTVLADEAVAAVLVVPENDWTAISKRVGLAALASDIASSIQVYLPHFGDLVAASAIWASTTFPGIVDESRLLAKYCSQAQSAFGELSRSLQGLGPNDPLPPAVRTEAQGVIENLAASTAVQDGTCKALFAAVLTFTTVNQTVDGAIAEYARRLGPDWAAITASTAAVNQATGRVLGGWQAITDDIGAIARGQVPVTTALLLGLGIDEAIREWAALERACADFARLADGQAGYLNGSWL